MPLKQAAAELGVTPDTLRQQIHAGHVTAIKLGRDWIVTRAEVERYRAERLDREVIANDGRTGRSRSVETKRVGIYCRVSTDEQAEQGYSLEDQETKARAMAVAKGWEVAGEPYIDDGYSGTLSAVHRPALKRLLQDIHAGSIDVVICTKMDRLARKLKLLLTTWDEIEECDCAVVVIKESIDTSTSTGRLIRNVLGSIAEFERDTILERTLAGKQIKITQRKEVLRSTPAYGYRYILRDKSLRAPGRLVVDEVTAPVVRRIFERQVASGMSTLKVAQLLTAEKIPTQKGRTTWGFSTIKQIVNNPTYYGQAPHGLHMVIGKGENGKQRRKRQPIEQGTYTDAPAIVSKDLWIAANEQLRETKSNRGGMPRMTTSWAAAL